MLDNFKSRLVRKLKLMLQNESVVTVTKDSVFGHKVTIRGSTISGHVDLGEGCKVVNGVQLYGESKISVGRYASLNGPNTDITSKFHPVVIGSFTSIARNVTIQEYNHRIDLATTYRIHANI